MTERVLIYHPKEADHYLALLQPLFPSLTFVACDNEQNLTAEIAQAEILIGHISFPVALLAEARRLRWIQVMAAGVNTWVPALPAGVRLSRVTGSFGPRMAEYAIGYVLAITQRMPELFRQQEDRAWQPLELGSAYGQTLGVAGLGSIGADVVRLAARVGLRVHGFSRTQPSLPELSAWYGPDQFHEFLASVDFVVLTLPATSKTGGLVNLAALESLRPTAWLINMARGDLIDEPALITALQRRLLAGAVLDVFQTEPLPADSPLWGMPNVIVTPHHAGETYAAEVVEVFSENLPRFRNGDPLINEVDITREY